MDDKPIMNRPKYLQQLHAFFAFLECLFSSFLFFWEPFNFIEQSHFQEVHYHVRNYPPFMEPSDSLPLSYRAPNGPVTNQTTWCISCVFNIYFNLILPYIYISNNAVTSSLWQSCSTSFWFTSLKVHVLYLTHFDLIILLGLSTYRTSSCNARLGWHTDWLFVGFMSSR